MNVTKLVCETKAEMSPFSPKQKCPPAYKANSDIETLRNPERPKS